MILVIAEKPSVAQSIAKVLGAANAVKATRILIIMSFHGMLALSWDLLMLVSTMNTMPSGDTPIYLSCQRNGFTKSRIIIRNDTFQT